jgi:hypothetical protein
VYAPVPEPKAKKAEPKNSEAKRDDTNDGGTNSSGTNSSGTNSSDANSSDANTRDEQVGAARPDKYQPKANDSQAVAAWRRRMGSPEAQELYKQRAATAECANAQARNRGLLRLPVRGLPKVKAVVGLFVIAHNLMRMAALAPELIGWGTGASAVSAMAA